MPIRSLPILPLVLLLVCGSASAQECTAEVDVRDQVGLKLDIAYRCQSGHPLHFTADGELLAGWLLEPRGFGFNPTIDIRVRTHDGTSFAAGLPRVGDAWRLGGNTNLRFAGFTAIGKLHHQEIAVPAPGSLRAGARKENGV